MNPKLKSLISNGIKLPDLEYELNGLLKISCRKKHKDTYFELDINDPTTFIDMPSKVPTKFLLRYIKFVNSFDKLKELYRKNKQYLKIINYYQNKLSNCPAYGYDYNKHIYDPKDLPEHIKINIWNMVIDHVIQNHNDFQQHDSNETQRNILWALRDLNRYELNDSKEAQTAKIQGIKKLEDVITPNTNNGIIYASDLYHIIAHHCVCDIQWPELPNALQKFSKFPAIFQKSLKNEIASSMINSIKYDNASTSFEFNMALIKTITQFMLVVGKGATFVD